jgi:DNA-binding NarL/FixJ family response regulator
MKQNDFDSVLTLSPRELEVFRALGSGQTCKEIADVLGLSVKTIEAHVANIRERTKTDCAIAVRHLATRFVIFCEQSKVTLEPAPVESRKPRFQFQPA